MQKHVSRRELLRRVEQGRQSMRVLAAAIVQAGGAIRVARDVFDGLPVGHRMTVEREALTGDLLLKAIVPDALRVQEISFGDLQARLRGFQHGSQSAESRDDRAEAAHSGDVEMERSHGPDDPVGPGHPAPQDGEG